MRTAIAGRLSELLGAREKVLTEFLEREQDAIARACHDLARAFARGGVLVPYGTGAAATDAAHVAVEFMHPVIVGKRALPAIAPSNDPTGALGVAGFGRADDIALGIAHGPADPSLHAFLARAGERGMIRVALVGEGGAAPEAEYVMTVASSDPAIVQEVQETAYHVLWELVHVFFEHPGLIEETCPTCGDVAVPARVVEANEQGVVVERKGRREQVAADLVAGAAVGDVLLCHAGVALERLDAAAPADPTAFLYPFLDRSETDLDLVLKDVRESTLLKGADVVALRSEVDLTAIEECGRKLRDRLDAGARIIAFGNGGSSTDAQDMACDFVAAGWPAFALNNDVATITAVGNDVGYENVFVRQLIALARPGDIAVAISTSGSSRNVIAALDEARRREMYTIGIAGYKGGRMDADNRLDWLLPAQGDYVPRLQEVQATIYHLLLESVGTR